jgi:site-specific recombinase XerD
MWAEAEREVDGWHRSPEQKQKKDRESLAVDKAIAKYLANCQSERNVANSTYISYQTTLKHLATFLKGADVTGIGAVTISHIRDFIETRKEFTPRTRRKELEQVRFFFNYCASCDWISKNPTRTEGKPIRVKVPKGGATMPLSDDEIDTLLDACDKITNPNMLWVPRARLRAKALILGMCFTGLRISDMITLRRSEVRRNGRVKDHVMVKTKNLVFTRFGQRALEALLAVPLEGDYFFWSGPKKSKISTATGSARRTLYSLQRMTGISVHPHRFRDTFALKVLEETGDIRVLQHLLGHASLATTEKAYQHLGPKHENRLEEALSKVSYAKREATTGQVIPFPVSSAESEE